MPLLLAASLFLTDPAPLDMPRAEAYLVREDGVSRLEDRYSRIDLWTARSVYGRWMDDDGRVFVISKLATLPPAVDENATVTRTQFDSESVSIGKKDAKRRRQAIERLSPIEIDVVGRAPSQMTRGYKDIDYWQGTNLTAIVCAFLPEKSDVWYLATWSLVEGDNIYERMEVFEREFLVREFKKICMDDMPLPASENQERARLRRDAHHSVTNYANWRWTDSPEFVVLDDLKSARSFVTSLTNELPALRAKYAETLPSTIDGSNVLCVARIYDSRGEYLDAVPEDMKWTAAYWSPERRELVAYMPIGGADELMKTIRHESFHQYLSYATSMISASPWINEGYAQYFEDEKSRAWGEGVVLTIETVEKLALSLPAIFGMDYEAFYSGTDSERRLKYRLAWSVAVFLEAGAPKIRFEPFKTLKRDYMTALLKSHDMHEATAAAFDSTDKIKLFVAEWKKFWKKQ